MIRNSNSIASALLGLTLWSGCGAPAGRPQEEGPHTPSASAVEEIHGLTLPHQVRELSRADAEALGSLRTACHSIDLSKLEYISGPATSQIASPSELAARIALCDTFNESQGDAAETSRSARLRALDAHLSQTLGTAEVSGVISKLIAIDIELEQLSSTAQSIKEADRTLIRLFLERADKEDTLASRFGVVLTREGTLVPVVATIHQPSSRHPLIAHVVRYPEEQHDQKPTGQTDAGGFIIINLDRFLQTSTISTSLTGIAANEFDSQIRARDGSFLELLLAGKMDQLKPVKPPPVFNPALASLYEGVMPVTPGEISELSSDAASTKVDRQDVSRIISNSIHHVLASLVRKSLGYSTPPLVRELVESRFQPVHNYALSEKLSVITLMCCYQSDGRIPEAKSFLDDAQKDADRLVQLFSRISKVQKQIDRTLEAGDGAKLDQLVEKMKKLLLEGQEAILEVNSRAEQIARDIPEAHRETISYVLQHYTDAFLQQVEELKE
jgi:hypothetical protein